MESPANNRVQEDNSCRIYLASNVFGKPTKNRREDPSMFELLTWGVDGFEKHSFKKDEKFVESTQAYLNMIGKYPWQSETHQNYINYHQHCIDANPHVLNKIENYIEERIPESSRIDKKSPQTNLLKKQATKSPCMQAQKKQNKNEMAHLKNPKNMPAKCPENEKPTPKETLRRQSVNNDRLGSPKHKHLQLEKKSLRPSSKLNKSQVYEPKFQKSKNQQPELTSNDQSKLIQQQTTRWIPNSSFTTYFGRPPFQNYGRGNTNPIDGGLVYGTYLYSHNVHPHRGTNDPKHIQSYPVALMKARSQGTLRPTQPRTKPDLSKTDIIRSNEGQEGLRSTIEPKNNNYSGNLNIEVPDLTEIQKFGGKKKSRASTQIN